MSAQNDILSGLVDCHLHLQGQEFADDLPDVLNRARDQHLRGMVCNGACPADWPAVYMLANQNPDIIPCFGVHPWYIKNLPDDWLLTLERFLTDIPSGVGEIGLDRWIEPRDETAMEEVFRQQLNLARRLNRPAMIHCLRAWDWLFDVLRNEPTFPAGILLHAFSGPEHMVPALVEKNAWFSVAGSALDPQRHKPHQAISYIPNDRLLLETDAPSLAPPDRWGPFNRPQPGKKPRSEPANLPAICQGLAEIKQMPPEELARQLNQNTEKFLGPLLLPRPQE